MNFLEPSDLFIIGRKLMKEIIKKAIEASV